MTKIFNFLGEEIIIQKNNNEIIIDEVKNEKIYELLKKIFFDLKDYPNEEFLDKLENTLEIINIIDDKLNILDENVALTYIEFYENELLEMKIKDKLNDIISDKGIKKALRTIEEFY